MITEQEKLNRLYKWLKDQEVPVWPLELIPVPDKEELKDLLKKYIDRAIKDPSLLQIEFSNNYKSIRIKQPTNLDHWKTYKRVPQ